MPRDLPVGNSRLLVCFDQDYQIRELYFPHVGQENHVNGNHCRFGVYAEPHFSWVGADWKRELNYEEDTLVTRVDLYHPGLETQLPIQEDSTALEEKAAQYRQAAAEIRDGASRVLWREDWGRFCRMVSRNKEGLLEADGTHDSSLWGLFAFGLCAPDDARIKATINHTGLTG